MDSEYENYVNLVQHQLDNYKHMVSSIVPDIWELDPDINETIALDILLPNGYFMKLEVDRETTLAEIKEVIFHIP